MTKQFRLKTLQLVFLALTSTLFAAAQSIEVQPPYQMHVFAQGVTGVYTQPDSIAILNGHVFIGYGDGVAKDGSDGKSSTIVEYRMNGSVVRTFSVLGHNDGLKVDPRTKLLWALQNEDGNPSLVTINATTLEQKQYSFAPTVHGGGYDDIVFKHGKAYLSASNPSSNPNNAPAIVRAELTGSSVSVTPVFAGDATATDILTDLPVTLNLQDPDSMITDPAGDIVLDSQDDAELVIVRHPDSAQQNALRIPLTSPFGSTKVDDTVFATASDGFILVSDLDANTVYAIHKHSFVPGAAYSAGIANGVVGLVGRLDLEFGQLTPIVTGLKNPRGMAFVAVPDEDRDQDSRADQLADACEVLN
jgi:hypothetical protein